MERDEPGGSSSEGAAGEEREMAMGEGNAGSEPTTSSLPIVYEDEQLLIVDKPAGMVVHPARGHREGTLAQRLAGIAAGGSHERPGIVHRLDKDTSGLLVVAKTEQAHGRLQAQMAAREIHREYLALVEGCPPSRTGTIEAPIGRDPRVRTRMAIGGVAARDAVTHFTVEDRFSRTSLLRLRLETGRTHQIRVHLRAIGHPVCGDPEYGTSGWDSTLGLTRQFLHATRLQLRHPVTGESLQARSPLPRDLQTALELAQRLS